MAAVPAWVVVPVLLLLVGFFVVPYLQIAAISFRTETPGQPFGGAYSVANFSGLLGDPFIWTVLWRTVRLALWTTVCCLVLGYPLAYQMARAGRRVRALLIASVLAPLLVGVIVRSYGWIVILADNGPVNDMLGALGLSTPRLLNSEFAVILGMVHVYLPFMVLSLLASLQSIEPDLERAARSMGASPGVVFRRVLWPLSRAGVAAGCSVVFILASSAYVIPSLLGGFNVVTTPILIVQLIVSRVNWPVGSALAGIHFVVTVAILVAVTVVVRGRVRPRVVASERAEGQGP
jgi:putative spermidine/putrescine transport system permease protein